MLRDAVYWAYCFLCLPDHNIGLLGASMSLREAIIEGIYTPSLTSLRSRLGSHSIPFTWELEDSSGGL